MSLLDSANELVTVYVETVSTDADGNTVVKPASEGVQARARIWPLSSTEVQAVGGDQTATRFGMRFPRAFPYVLGAKAQISWNGKRYSVVGDPLVYNGSANTRRIQYVLERS